MGQWIKTEDYYGPDRRQGDQGPPEGQPERRGQDPIWVDPPDGAA